MNQDRSREQWPMVPPGLWGARASSLVTQLSGPHPPDQKDTIARAVILPLAAAVSTLRVLLDEQGAEMVMDLTSNANAPAPEQVRWPTAGVIYVEFGETIRTPDDGHLHGLIFTAEAADGHRSILSPVFQGSELTVFATEVEAATFRIIPNGGIPSAPGAVSRYHHMIHLMTSPATCLEPLPLTPEQSAHLEAHGAENPWRVIRAKT